VEPRLSYLVEVDDPGWDQACPPELSRRALLLARHLGEVLREPIASEGTGVPRAVTRELHELRLEMRETLLDHRDRGHLLDAGSRGIARQTITDHGESTATVEKLRVPHRERVPRHLTTSRLVDDTLALVVVSLEHSTDHERLHVHVIDERVDDLVSQLNLDARAEEVHSLRNVALRHPEDGVQGLDKPAPGRDGEDDDLRQLSIQLQGECSRDILVAIDSDVDTRNTCVEGAIDELHELLERSFRFARVRLEEPGTDEELHGIPPAVCRVKRQ